MAKRRTQFNHRHTNDHSVARKRAAAVSTVKWLVGAASFIDTLLSIIDKIAKIK